MLLHVKGTESEKSTPLALMLSVSVADDDNEEEEEGVGGAEHCRRVLVMALAGTTAGPNRHHRPICI